MQARVKKKGEITILELFGNVDFESAKPFHDQCTTFIKDANHQRVVFNMKGLRFVGSSGISCFIQTLREFNHLSIKPRFCGVGSEFKKMFRIYSPEETYEIFASEDEAAGSFTATTQKTG